MRPETVDFAAQSYSPVPFVKLRALNSGRGSGLLIKPVNMAKRILTSAIQALLLLTVTTCNGRFPVAGPDGAPVMKAEATIAAVGDVMMPLSIQKAVARNNNRYDLLFEKIAPDLRKADIAIANLETPIDPTGPVSGYPRFNARPELLSAIRKAGIGFLSVANNHALDRGPAGLTRTLDNIDAAGLRRIGAGRTKVEGEDAVLVSLGTITFGFLAYTYGTNAGMPKKKKFPAAVNILRNGSDADLARAIASVHKARGGADFVVVSLHWGEEYHTTPSAWQRRVAKRLIDEGADVILGHHSHVLQPIESYTARDGRRGLIAFSLGNCIASQNFGISNRNRTLPRARLGDGIILRITVVKDGTQTAIVRTDYQPMWINREKINGVTVYRPVIDTREIQRLAAKKSRTFEEDGLMALLAYRLKVVTKRLGRMNGTVPWDGGRKSKEPAGVVAVK